MYNTFASSVLSSADASSGLQLAIWELIYNDMTGPVTASQLTSPTKANPQGNNIVGLTAGTNCSPSDFSTIINDAVSDINASVNQSQLALALIINNQTNQSLMISGGINFTNATQATPAISTQASESNGGVVGVSVLGDVAALTAATARPGRSPSR